MTTGGESKGNSVGPVGLNSVRQPFRYQLLHGFTKRDGVLRQAERNLSNAWKFRPETSVSGQLYSLERVVTQHMICLHASFNIGTKPV